MKRYYLCSVVQDNSGELPVRRPKAQFYGGNTAVVVNDLAGWALVQVAAPDHTSLLNDADIDALPDVPLDTPISSLSTAEWEGLLAVGAKYGIDIAGAVTFREVVRRTGQMLDAAFDEHHCCVGE